MANPFDQFDVKTANPFDKFDAQQAGSLGDQAKAAIKDIPRQIGLTARYGLEGIGNTLDFIASPVRALQNAVTPDQYAAKPGVLSRLADTIGLPTPQTPTERVVGDVSRTVAGAVPMIKGAQLASNATTGVMQGVMKSVGSNPGQQLVSAGAAGAAGGTVKEAGGGDGAQTAASILAGISAPGAMRVGPTIAGKFQRAPDLMPKVNAHIDGAIGQDFSLFPQDVQNGIRADVAKALTSGDSISPAAVRRLADYRLTGATPTAATLTLDPAAVTQQKNLAKLGMNSKDPIAQQLGQVQNANNNKLIGGLNELGAENSTGQFNAGQQLLNKLSGYATQQKGKISSLYDAARDSTGRAASLDHVQFTQNVGDGLDKANINTFLPDQIKTMVNKFATGEVPLNVNTAEQFKTIVGNAQRATNDGNVKAALSIVRSSLDDAPLLQNKVNALAGTGQDSIDAFNAARSANRSFMQTVDKTPSLAAAIDDAHPDSFFQKHVLTAPVGDLNNTLNVVGKDGASTIKTQLLSYLKSKAINGANDEVGNFSQSAFKKALDSIGDQKLSMFLSPQEMGQLKAISRVASYEQFQPSGSAVNNSNTAGATIATVLDRIGSSPLLSKIPFGHVAAQPAQNIAVGMRAKQAMDVPSAISLPIPRQRGGNLLMSPALFMGTDDERKNSLAP